MNASRLITVVFLSMSAAGHAVAGCTWDCGDGDDNVAIVDFLALLGGWGLPGPCDFDGGGVGIGDFLELLANWGPCPVMGACCSPGDGGCTVQWLADCNAAGGVFAGGGTDCTDTDNDRIPDAFELNDCMAAAGACFTGTDPNKVDTDGDWISDGDELYGTLDGLDLPAMGADPCHQDIFLETDWVYTTGQLEDRNKLHVNQVTRLVTAFAVSGVSNPDGVPGVKLHIDYGQAPYSGGNSVFDADGVVDTAPQLDGGDFALIKANNFDANRHTYFHYSLMCDAYSLTGNPTGSSGLGEFVGDDFLVSMGQYGLGDDNRIGHTLLHELGHNLGLRHGGDVNDNHKPNYNSVMNYYYQFCGVDGDFDAMSDDLADYSHGVNIDLDDSLLVEPVGVTGIGPGIDWNVDGDAVDTMAYNINCRLNNSLVCIELSMAPAPCGEAADHCSGIDCGPMWDFDDWGALRLQGIHDTDFAPAEVIYCGPDEPALISD